MNSKSLCRHAGILVAGALVASWGYAADEARATAQTVRAPTSTSAAPRTSSTRPISGKGPLPDPTLLDGSSQPVEKKSEQGMIGEFELPGDENVRNGKVGGPQNPNPANAGGQQNNMPMGMPQGAGGGPQNQQAKQGGGQPPPGAQQPAGAQGAGGQQGPENPNAGGQQIAGAGDPGAQPQGVQVAELGGAAGGQQAPAGAAGANDKPQQMAIGDKAMRIDPSQPAPGIVGGQQQVPAGHTQQHDKGTGSGGKGPAGGPGGGRIEKGKTMPAGL